MDLSVIIVSYNVRFFLEQALAAVVKASKGLHVETWVVDNHSADGSAMMVRDKYPDVHLIANDNNPGFAKANNQAIRQANGKYILLLNPDTIIAEDTLVKCFAFMESHPETGGLGVRMIDGSGTFLPESKRGFPSPFVAFCKAFGLSRLFPKSRIFNQYHLGFISEYQTSTVDILSGAFMWIRKEALDKAGLLDEQFFMYGEDIDLSYRLTNAGYVNYYYPEATIIHFKGESTRKGTLNYIRVFYQAMLLFARKHFTGPGKSFYVTLIQFAIYLRAGISLFRQLAQRLGPLMFDAALLYGTLILIRHFWAGYYFNDPGYYPPTFDTINAPLYTLIWIVSLYLSGAYDRRYDLWSAGRGLLFGSLVIAAVYGFLDTPLRNSRAIIVISTWVALCVILFVRMVRYYLRYRKLWPSSHFGHNVVVIGSPSECERAENLLLKTGVKKHIIGRVATESNFDPTYYLNHIQRLPDIVRAFRVDEIIFCLQDITSGQMMQWMNQIGPAIDYRVLPEGGLSIMGSASRHAQGDLYIADSYFDLADPVLRRHKRISDILMALIMVMLSPWLLWLQKNKKQLLIHIGLLLSGKKTMVGYPSEYSDLPSLKPGLLTPAHAHPEVSMDAHTLRHLCFRYARDYRVFLDWQIFFRNLSTLDRN